MRILVTGGTGYLGSAIVRALAARGHTPVIFSRRAAAGSVPGVPMSGDVRDLAALGRAAEGCDAICHTAALVALWRPRRAEFDEVNVGGLENVVAVARERAIPRIVYTSSFIALPPNGSAVEQERNDYQRTKVAAHRAAHRAIDDGAPIVVLYPGVVYGPGARTDGNLVGRLVADHLAGRLPGLVGADAVWSYAYVEDVAAGHVAALERGRAGAGYRLCGENAPQMRVFEIVRELTGRPPPRRLPRAVAKLVGAFEEARSAILRTTPLLTRGTVDILTSDWAFDSDLAIAELGYRITPLSVGIERVVAELTTPIAPGAAR
jgi:farnesol dehydrogenase